MVQYLPEQANLKILVVDDHELLLAGTIEPLRQKYPEAQIITAQNAENAISEVERHQPNLVILDISIPKTTGMTPEVDTGIELLSTLMKKKLKINIVILSSNAHKLVRINYEIKAYEGGFTIADKSSVKDLLAKVNWSLSGVVHTRDVKEMRTGELMPEWLKLLELASKGLQDKAIAKQINISERTIGNYWEKIQNVLDVHPESNEDRRVVTLRKAREIGFID
jgi:DNA-binding NarL/FixJ family response regulator